MKSGLEGRNNHFRQSIFSAFIKVSMKSGLEGRNNITNNSYLDYLASKSQ